MELRQLQYFLTVAEELNFSRAAERLQITQPPLSLQIQNLERELGFPLFYRTNRHVELTDAGKVFADEVRKMLDYLSRAVENAKRTHHGEIGKLTVGFVGSATYDILPVVLREFRSLYPNVQVHLIELPTPKQIEALREDEIDVGVLRPPVHDEEIHTEIVSSVPCVLAVPKQHPLVHSKNISLGNLTPYPFVMLSRKTWAGLYDEILGLCNPTIQQEAFEFQTVIGLVAAGMGIAVVPQSAMNLHTQHVDYIDLKDQLPVASMGVSWRRNDQSPLVKTFVEIAMEMG
ncbi:MULTISPECIES: LysR family transcriptional regulator [unclassified Paenibacillus]|uniref:LysR family transcriptional regulator n=1 Tax=unclassified Paenibacillus TaxID=185978 RepID=UPI001AE6E85D|nr:MULTISPECIES: LysR family transcriptional regulator [unclassified Paenibacillus]MBP1154278.1 DNA-binding transcriptional LysR family regulator [Paenibacillus sp. PvP091]MBP1170337.1 DNA-binding transcriptional LysR family regulator [Paenibacillus sp. PvR098]MBP2441365.1 DNA-binding transcriptional LysR family regulator [Paenibacillus sp. PvP052]